LSPVGSSGNYTAVRAVIKKRISRDLMYRVTAQLLNGEVSITCHPTAKATLTEIVALRQSGGKVTVDDANSVKLSDNELVKLMAKEERDSAKT
jgi:hypothetical protein